MAEHNREVIMEWEIDKIFLSSKVEVTSSRGNYIWMITDLEMHIDGDLAPMTNDEVQFLKEEVKRHIKVSHEHDEDDDCWDKWDRDESNHRNT